MYYKVIKSIYPQINKTKKKTLLLKPIVVAGKGSRFCDFFYKGEKYFYSLLYTFIYINIGNGNRIE